MLTGNLIEDVQAELDVQIEETVNAYSGLGKGPVLKQVMRFYRKYEKEIFILNEEAACRSGCNFCCHYHVVVSAPEVFALVEFIDKLPKLEREDLHDRIKKTAEVTTNLTAQEYIVTNVPCALLKDGRCSVYEVRPIACRGHHSLDMKVCEDTFKDTRSDALAPMSYERNVKTTALQNAHLISQKHKKLDTMAYELHAALHQAITNKGLFQRWRDHKMAFPNVRDRSDPFTQAENFG
jgi:Fe-S-cluster containining protein